MTVASSIIIQRPPTDAEYALIPDVDDTEGIFDKHSNFVGDVRALMQRHNAQSDFALFAFHKHYNVPKGHILLLTPITLPSGDKAEVVCPVSFPKAVDLRPVAFYVSGDKLQPYKYADGPGRSLVPFENFLQEFVILTKQYDVADLFAIKLPNVSPDINMWEAEIPEYGGTVLAPPKFIEDGCEEQMEGKTAASLMLGDCGAWEDHIQNANGTYSVLLANKKKGNAFLEAVFAVLESLPVPINADYYKSLEDKTLANVVMDTVPRPIVSI